MRVWGRISGVAASPAAAGFTPCCDSYFYVLALDSSAPLARRQRFQVDSCFGGHPARDRRGIHERLFLTNLRRRAHIPLYYPSGAPAARQYSPVHAQFTRDAARARADPRPVAPFRLRESRRGCLRDRRLLSRCAQFLAARGRLGTVCALFRQRFSRLDDVSKQGANGNHIAGRGRVGRQPQNAALEDFDLLCGLVPLHSEQQITRLDVVSVLFQPLAKDALFHRPSQARHGHFIGHQTSLRSFCEQIANALFDLVWLRRYRVLQGWAVRCRHVRAVETPDRRVQVVKSGVNDLGRDLRRRYAARLKRLVHNQTGGRSSGRTRKSVSMSNGAIVRGSITSTDIRPPRSAFRTRQWVLSTIEPIATAVQSFAPSRAMRAFPNGIS